MAGLSENFSTQQYFSRYCYTTLKDFKLNPFKRCTMRNQREYEYDIKKMELSGKPYKGIKQKSVFNSLSHFNLFDFGMPPCIAHDLFLGCFNYDLMLIFRGLTKRKLIGETYLKNRINFLMKKLGLNSQITLNFKKKAISSKAIDVWHLIRIVPFIFLKIPYLYKSKLFQLVLLLKKITDLITAPTISPQQIGSLKLCIEHYLENRSSMFNSPLKPKHHYLWHYPHLILQFGPLLPFSTLTGERKHSYFKTALRHASNFKNILKLCAERHQYFQALISEINPKRFQESIICNSGVATCEHLKDSDKKHLESFGMINHALKYTKSITFRGDCYNVGDFLFVAYDKSGEQFYVIELKGFILGADIHELYIYGSYILVEPIIERGINILDKEKDKFECMLLNSLPDITPLKIYECDGKRYLFQKHAFPWQ
ncbi:uncharacterized protein LOC131428918 [Malaya genurostris]|uniref:uncharacterized protein LOC131428918 n=1 Tax=Malaya genurostris TaxID=325434 RepID=UPI0026F3960D|nr:uncharacterized protein LOC131428918 [Malaya genurostris]